MGLFDLLSLDVVQYIFSHLPPWDLICVVPHVCRSWAQVCRRASLMALLCEETHGLVGLEKCAKGWAVHKHHA